MAAIKPQAVSARASRAGSSSLASDRQGLLGLIQADGADPNSREHGSVGERPRPHRGRHPGVVRVEVGEGGVEPGQPFPEAAPRLP